MEKIVFAKSWQGGFAGFGLESFSDFFNFAGGKIINKNTKRDVQQLTLGNGDDSKVFFMKRFYRPYLKDIFFSWQNFGQPKPQAVIEWENANFLLEKGIETYRPVCFGLRTRLGIEKKSFFITEKLNGCCLTDFIAQRRGRLTQQQKEEIIVQLAKMIRKVHDTGVSLPDLYLWHIFITENAGQWEFAVIDLHRMVRNVRDKNKQIMNLGRLHHSMLDKYFDDSLRWLFIESYAADDWPGRAAKLGRKIKKYSNKVSAKRNPKQY